MKHYRHRGGSLISHQTQYIDPWTSKNSNIGGSLWTGGSLDNSVKGVRSRFDSHSIGLSNHPQSAHDTLLNMNHHDWNAMKESATQLRGQQNHPDWPILSHKNVQHPESYYGLIQKIPHASIAAELLQKEIEENPQGGGFWNTLKHVGRTVSTITKGANHLVGNIASNPAIAAAMPELSTYAALAKPFTGIASDLASGKLTKSSPSGGSLPTGGGISGGGVTGGNEFQDSGAGFWQHVQKLFHQGRSVGSKALKHVSIANEHLGTISQGIQNASTNLKENHPQISSHLNKIGNTSSLIHSKVNEGVQLGKNIESGKLFNPPKPQEGGNLKDHPAIIRKNNSIAQQQVPGTHQGSGVNMKFNHAKHPIVIGSGLENDNFKLKKQKY